MNGRRLPNECLYNPQVLIDNIENFLRKNKADKYLQDDYTYILASDYKHMLRGNDITQVTSCKIMQNVYKESILFYPYQALTISMLTNIFEKSIEPEDQNSGNRAVI